MTGLRRMPNTIAQLLRSYADAFSSYEEGLTLAPENWNSMRELMIEAADALCARSAGTRIAPPHLTEMFCLNLAVCVEGGIEISQASRNGLLKKLTDLREWCKTPQSATEPTDE